jgi:hypothetical protein
MSIKEIDRILSNTNLPKEIRDSLIKKRDLLLKNKEVKK